jgi:hypothetical protein
MYPPGKGVTVISVGTGLIGIGPDAITPGNKQLFTAGTGIVGDVNIIVDGSTGYSYGLYARKRVSGFALSTAVIVSISARVCADDELPPAEIPCRGAPL